MDVRLVPPLADEETQKFLQQLRIEWPSGLEISSNSEDILAMKDALHQCPHAVFSEADQEGVVCKLHLKGILGKQQQKKEKLEGYDPNLDVFLGRYHLSTSFASLPKVDCDISVSVLILSQCRSP